MDPTNPRHGSMIPSSLGHKHITQCLFLQQQQNPQTERGPVYDSLDLLIAESLLSANVKIQADFGLLYG
jgi:hypothetical protein